MGNLTVEFLGMCTHVLEKVDRWEHRVVLPMPFQTKIDEHQARLHVSKAAAPDVSGFVNGSSIVVESETPQGWILALRGVELWVADTSGAYKLGPNFECGVFRLRDYTGGEPLPPLNQTVWKGKQKTRAHVYFNVEHGVFSARRHGKATVGVLQMTTSTEKVTIHAAPFAASERPTSLTLTGEEPQVMLSHTNPKCDGDDEHFILHFELAQSVPKNPKFPFEAAPCLDPGGVYQGLGAGCSNSTFP